MATATDFDEEVSCIICSDIFVNPKILPCMHTFCESCVQRLNRVNYVTCPLCQGNYHLNDAKHDFNKQRLIDIYNRASKDERWFQKFQTPKDQIQKLQTVVETNTEQLRNQLDVYKDLFSTTFQATQQLDDYKQKICDEKVLVTEKIARSEKKYVDTVKKAHAKLGEKVDKLSELYISEIDENAISQRQTMSEIRSRITQGRGVIETILEKVDLEILRDDEAVSDIIGNAKEETTALRKEIAEVKLPAMKPKVFTVEGDDIAALECLDISLGDPKPRVPHHMEDALTAKSYRGTDLVDLKNKELQITSIFTYKKSPLSVRNIRGTIWSINRDGSITKHGSESEEMFVFRRGNVKVNVLALSETEDLRFVASCIGKGISATGSLENEDELLVEITENGTIKEVIDKNLYIELRSCRKTILGLTAAKSRKLQCITAFIYESAWKVQAEMKLGNYIYNGFCELNGTFHVSMGEYPYAIHVYNKMGIHTNSYGGIRRQTLENPLKTSLLLSSNNCILIADGNALRLGNNTSTTTTKLKCEIRNPVSATMNHAGVLYVVSEEDRQLYLIREKEWWMSSEFLFSTLPMMVAIIAVGLVFVLLAAASNM